jgi:hypothetical protein
MRANRQPHRDLSPEARRKSNARAYATVYQKRGKLIPRPCEVCGSLMVEKHHEDYSKPLMVRWLCRPCHQEMHKKKSSSNRA